MAKRKKGKSRKQLLQQQARDILGPGMFEYHCRAAAEKLGTTWDGQKGTGYALLQTLVNRFYPGHRQPAPPVKKAYKAPRIRQSGSVIFQADPCSDEFLKSYEWLRLRMEVLKEFGRICQCCGAKPGGDVQIHVDHIKPRKRFPHLALERSNLQVLCGDCNLGKGNWDETDWRGDAPSHPAAPVAPAPVTEFVTGGPRLVKKVRAITESDFKPVWAAS